MISILSMQSLTQKVISRSIFIAGLACVLLSSILHINEVFYWITGIIAITYLFAGWYFFKGYLPEGKTWFLFLLGYIYSGIFLGAAFADPKFAEAAELLRASTFWSVTLLGILIITIILKKENFQKGLKNFIIEALLLLTISIIQGIINKV